MPSTYIKSWKFFYVCIRDNNKTNGSNTNNDSDSNNNNSNNNLI